MCACVGVCVCPCAMGSACRPDDPVKRAQMAGFVYYDYMDEFPAAIEQMAESLVKGEMVYRTHLIQGLQKAPEALQLLFSGGNSGKVIVQVSSSSKL